MPVLINAFGTARAHGGGTGRGAAGRGVRARGQASRPPHARLAVRQAPQAGHLIDVAKAGPKRVRSAPCQEIVETATPAWPPSPSCSAGRATPARYITLPLVFTRDPALGRAERRHVPAAGLRRADARHALADPQGLGRAPSRSPRSAAALGWKWRSRSAAIPSRSTPARRPAARRRRDGVRRLAARRRRHHGGVPDAGPRGAGRKRRSCWRAGWIRRSGGVEGPSAITPATTRWPATIRCSTCRR